MFIHKVKIDERMRSNTRYAAAVWLGVTQILLAGVIFYRLYVLGQPDAEIRDFQIVMVISIFGFLALQLFLGGVMPIPTWRGALAVYLALTFVIVTVCLIIYGWPRRDEWASTWLPALSGPALILFGYVLVARLGHWRVERQINKLGE